ncbi:MAG: class I SAM-dependent methyltransferase [Acidobacteriaceae bacterium]
MSLNYGTDLDWEKWGKQDPYFGVLSDPKYLSANLNNKSLAEFFATGERHVEHVLELIRHKLKRDFQPVRVLDYGCGTGRLLIPFAKRAQTVVGVDVSQSMLAEARENCQKFDVSSAQLLHSDEIDSLAPASFDLVHSFIVFQHIPVAQGELVLRKLIGLIAEGGIGALHFTYSNPRPLTDRLVTGLRNRVKLVHGVLNLMKRRPFSTPAMQMNCYSIERIFDILLESNCSNVSVEFSHHGVTHGAMLYFQKTHKSTL